MSIHQEGMETVHVHIIEKRGGRKIGYNSHIPLDIENTGLELKEKICVQSDIPVQFQRLMFGKYTLLDSRKLRDQGMTNVQGQVVSIHHPTVQDFINLVGKVQQEVVQLKEENIKLQGDKVKLEEDKVKLEEDKVNQVSKLNQDKDEFRHDKTRLVQETAQLKRHVNLMWELIGKRQKLGLSKSPSPTVPDSTSSL